MRKRLLSAATAMTLAIGPVVAQEVLVDTQEDHELRADWIVGATVTSTEGETIGSIQDLIVDGQESGVTAAIIGVGGFLGFGAKNIAVDFAELQIDWDGNQVVLDLTREQAEEAAEFEFRDRLYEPAPEPDSPPLTGGGGGSAPAPTGGAMD